MKNQLQTPATDQSNILFERVYESLYVGTEYLNKRSKDVRSRRAYFGDGVAENTPVTAEGLLNSAIATDQLRAWIKMAIKAHLAHPEGGQGYHQATDLNPFAGEPLYKLVDHLNEIRSWFNQPPTTLEWQIIKFQKMQDC